MTFLKKILKAPIRTTTIVLVASLIAYSLLTFALVYLTRVMCADTYLNSGSCRGTNLQMFSSMILDDFKLLFRIIAEISVIVLISQVVYRIATKSS